jgi:hypothetical protein
MKEAKGGLRSVTLGWSHCFPEPLMLVSDGSVGGNGASEHVRFSEILDSVFTVWVHQLHRGTKLNSWYHVPSTAQGCLYPAFPWSFAAFLSRNTEESGGWDSDPKLGVPPLAIGDSAWEDWRWMVPTIGPAFATGSCRNRTVLAAFIEFLSAKAPQLF